MERSRSGCSLDLQGKQWYVSRVFGCAFLLSKSLSPWRRFDYTISGRGLTLF